jgi:hypothetical protein
LFLSLPVLKIVRGHASITQTPYNASGKLQVGKGKEGKGGQDIKKGKTYNRRKDTGP